VTWEQVLAAAPDVLLLMPCGFTVSRTLRELDRLSCDSSWPGWRTLPAVRDGHVFAVDASAYFSRPGPRLVDGVELLAALFHPSLLGGVRPADACRVNLREHNPTVRAR
ncbi:MAG: ABC transporter substrate-binding protein, partial [Burkholderiales bacterium]